MTPFEGLRCPKMSSNRVDFPTPLGPTIALISPLFRVNEKESNINISFVYPKDIFSISKTDLNESALCRTLCIYRWLAPQHPSVREHGACSY